VTVDSRLEEAVSHFGSVIASRFAIGAGEPEDLLRGPFEGLLDDLAAIAGISPVVVAGEHHLTDERVSLLHEWRCVLRKAS
jgi:hypothetical protein